MSNYTINLDTGGSYSGNVISRILDEVPGMYSNYVANKRAQAAEVRAQENHDAQMAEYQRMLKANQDSKLSKQILEQYTRGDFDYETLYSAQPSDEVGQDAWRTRHKEFFASKPKDPYTAYLSYAKEMEGAGLTPSPEAFYTLYVPALKSFQSQKTGKFNDIYRQVAEKTNANVDQMASIMKTQYGGESMLSTNNLVFSGDPNMPGLMYAGYQAPKDESWFDWGKSFVYDEPVEYGGMEYGGGLKLPGGTSGATTVGIGAAGYGAWNQYGEYKDIKGAFATKVKDDMANMHHSTFKKNYGFTQKSVRNLSDDEIFKKAKQSTKTRFFAQTKLGSNLNLIKQGALPYAAMSLAGEVKDRTIGTPLLDRLPGGKEGKASRVTQEVSDMTKVPLTAATVGLYQKAQQKLKEQGFSAIKKVIKKKGYTWLAKRAGKAGIAGLATYFSGGLGAAVSYGFIAKDMYDIAVILAED